MPFLGFVRERMEIPNLVKPPHAVQGVEVVGITRSQFAGFQVNIVVIKVKLLARAFKFYLYNIEGLIVCRHIHVGKPVVNVQFAAAIGEA